MQKINIQTKNGLSRNCVLQLFLAIQQIVVAKNVIHLHMYNNVKLSQTVVKSTPLWTHFYKEKLFKL